MRSLIRLALCSLIGLALTGACSDLRDLTAPKSPDKATLVPIAPIERYPIRPYWNPEDFADITAGDEFTCARKYNGNVYCWGIDTQGQVGRLPKGNCPAGACVDRPMLVTTASQIDAGSSHVCTLDANGAAYCWGDGNNGQVAFQAGSYGPVYAPMPVVPPYGQTTPLTFKSISAGTMSTCGTGPSGVYCWGEIASKAPYPTLVSSFNGFTRITVGYVHACGIIQFSGMSEVDCWGQNLYGQTGSPMAQWTSVPFALSSGLGSISTTVTSQAYFTCADQNDGTVKCMGDNGWGQLGGGPIGVYATDVAQTVGSTNGAGGMQLHGVSTGRHHACALDPNGYAYCWGNGYNGQLGNGPQWPVPVSTPTAVTGGRQFRAIAAGARHTCAIGTDNHLYCWGNNHFGQLGTQYPGGWVNYPVQAIDP